MVIDRECTGLAKGASLNEAQQLVVPFIGNSDVNLLLKWPTNSGKTTGIVMMASAPLKAGGLFLYVAPTKALVEEKRVEWTNPEHPFSKYKLAIITGDYLATDSRQKEVNDSQIIVITPESLVSRLRRLSSVKNQWLHRVKIIVPDEFHLIGEDGRGANLEAALIEFTTAFPDVPIIAPSGTIPNHEDIAEWFTNLNKKKTIVLISDYRRTKLEHIFIKFTPGYNKNTEPVRAGQILKLVTDNPTETFLVGVFRKPFGELLYKVLRKAEVSVEFYHSDLSKDARRRIESAFEKGFIRVLISTSGLFTGVNKPADNSICTAVEAGGQELKAHIIQQLAGRAGRFKDGKAYYFIPDDKSFDYHQKRILEGEPINSTLTKLPYLSTHFLGATYLERVKSPSDFYDWYAKTLAHVQMNYSKDHAREMLNGVLEAMVNRGMVSMDEESKAIAIRHRGTIAAQLLLDPYHLYDLLVNIRKYLLLEEANDCHLAAALGSCSPFWAPYLPTLEQEYVPTTIRKVAKQGYWRSSSVFYYRLIQKEVPVPFKSINFQIYHDLGRVKEGVIRCCKESEHWDEKLTKATIIPSDYINIMFTRVARGLSMQQAQQAIRGFKRREIDALNKVGIFTLEDAKRNVELASLVLSPKRMQELSISE
jgi:replicative superfamily II helicase